MENITEVKGIGNYYGGLSIGTLDGRYFWIIENYDTDFNDKTEWTEIPYDIYAAILKDNPK